MPVVGVRIVGIGEGEGKESGWVIEEGGDGCWCVGGDHKVQRGDDGFGFSGKGWEDVVWVIA